MLNRDNVSIFLFCSWSPRFVIFIFFINPPYQSSIIWNRLVAFAKDQSGVDQFPTRFSPPRFIYLRTVIGAGRIKSWASLYWDPILQRWGPALPGILYIFESTHDQRKDSLLLNALDEGDASVSWRWSYLLPRVIEGFTGSRHPKTRELVLTARGRWCSFQLFSQLLRWYLFGMKRSFCLGVCV